MYAESFASKLKKARLNTGFTQKEVQAETGISQVSLSKYESGITEPSIETLGILADFYQVSTDWLISTSYGKNAQEQKKEPQQSNPLRLYVSGRDNIVNESGNVYIELTPEQARKIKEATE